MKSNTESLGVLLFIVTPIITIFLCYQADVERHKADAQAWQQHHDKYKWGDPPMPHGNDTNSVMDPWGTNGWEEGKP